MKRVNFNLWWRVLHLLAIGFLLGIMLWRCGYTFNHPIDIHIPTSEELIEIMDFDNSRPVEIETENGEFVSVYES